MANKKLWSRFGNLFCIDKKEGQSGIPIIKRKKSKLQNNMRKSPVAENAQSGGADRKNTSEYTKNLKNIEPFLIETSLQLPGTEEKTEPIDLIIGFDIGTAWTKVVIQETAGRRAVAISFKEYGSALNPFLLPTRVGFLNGHLALCKKDDPHHICTDLKISLMEDPKQIIKTDKELTVTSCELAATFIALVLRYARCLFIKTHADIYRHNRLRWHLNLGIPVKNYDDTLIKEAFHHAALTGWWLSAQKGEIALTSAKEGLQKIQNLDFQPDIHRDYINVVPEVAAEVAGYANSDLREEGLHMLVDIGATTLDVSTFILDKKDGEDHYKFLSAEIGPFGAFELHRTRLPAFRDFLLSYCLSKVDGIAETLEPIPDSCDHYLPIKNDIPDFDEKFIQKAAILITKVIAETKQRRDRNSEAWEKGLTLFLCGGGSLAKFYSEKLLDHVENSLNGIIWQGFRKKQIPKPDKLLADGLKSQDYHRLAVAYGLSFLYENIGRITPPADIPDIPPDRRHNGYEDRFISNDMV